MTHALRTAICVIIGALMASTICFTSFDLPHPLHGVPYILAVALTINTPRQRGPGALTGMVAGLLAATAAYVTLTYHGFYKELWFAGHTVLSAVTLVLCGGLMLLDRRASGIATYNRYPPVAVIYGLLTVASVIMLPVSRTSDMFTPPFEILRRLIVYSTLVMFYPGLILAVVLNFFKPRHATPQHATPQ